jgi:hypothetical protein
MTIGPVFMEEPWLTGCPVFGHLSPGEIVQFFDTAFR